ncbi:MAG: hypothetical protein P4L46_25155 [Fimbriimonas sp.]|nr:hypothetical protein [Fimbriimonas sp.]
MQYYDTGYLQILLVVVLVAFILYNITRAKQGKSLFIRRIAGLNAIEEAVGRSTEMGRPVLMVPGLSVLGPVGIQAVNIFAYITRKAAKFGTPIRMCLADPALYSVAQEIIRDVYQSEGIPDQYDSTSVRFISDRQFAFAAGVVGTIMREKVAACFLMGDWYAESLILAESANEIGAIQVAASTITTQTPFLIAACDYVLIGDEFYAASAYLSREPVLVGSLIGQDWSKMLIAGVILALTAQASFEKAFVQQTFKESQKGDRQIWTREDITPRLKKKSELLEFRLFHPHDPEAVFPKRDKIKLQPWEKDDTGGSQ